MRLRTSWLWNTVSAAASAASAFVRLEVLRIDRLSDGAFYARGGVCIDCPSHRPAAGGQLGTCGSAINIINRRAGGPCGCHLNLKARDRRARCPEGRWVVVDLTFSKLKD